MNVEKWWSMFLALVASIAALLSLIGAEIAPPPVQPEPEPTWVYSYWCPAGYSPGVENGKVECWWIGMPTPVPPEVGYP